MEQILTNENCFGYINIDLALRIGKPHSLTDSSTSKEENL